MLLFLAILKWFGADIFLLVHEKLFIFHMWSIKYKISNEYI